jgi:hypothetical protein
MMDENDVGIFPGDDQDSWGERKGWDRPSIAFKSRKSYWPEIGPDDLRLPSEASKLRTWALCAACAAAMTVLYGVFPLLLIGVFVPLGSWYGRVLLMMFVLLATGLSVYSVFETRSLRKLAREL